MTTAYVLTGGGSLGAVQVGMLQALAARGVAPDVLVGTSVGALNAAWVATRGADAAALQGLADVWCRLTRHRLFPLHAPRVLRAVGGRADSLVAPDRLRALVEACTPDLPGLDATGIPLHVVAADLLTGETVVLDHGPLADAVMASAAVPGILPPVVLGGRPLVDGAVGSTTGVAVAHGLGVDEVYVLPTGTACALPQVPRSALGHALQALSLLTHRHTAGDVARLATETRIRLLPPLCPVRTAASDFSHAPELISRSRRASLAWIDAGNLDLPDPHRFLALHTHAPLRGAAGGTGSPAAGRQRVDQPG